MDVYCLNYKQNFVQKTCPTSPNVLSNNENKIRIMALFLIFTLFVCVVVENKS